MWLSGVTDRRRESDKIGKTLGQTRTGLDVKTQTRTKSVLSFFSPKISNKEILLHTHAYIILFSDPFQGELHTKWSFTPKYFSLCFLRLGIPFYILWDNSRVHHLHGQYLYLMYCLCSYLPVISCWPLECSSPTPRTGSSLSCIIFSCQVSLASFHLEHLHSLSWVFFLWHCHFSRLHHPLSC